MKKDKQKALMIDSLITNDYSLFLCNELANQGVDISLVITEDRDISITTSFNLFRLMPSKNQSKSKLLKVLIFPIYLLKVLVLIFKEKFTIVHYQFFRLKSIESLFCIFLKKLNIRIIHTAHEVLLPGENKLEIFFNKLIYKYSDALLVHSKVNKAAICNSYKVDPKKIFVVPHGSFNFYDKSSEITSEKARVELGISQNKIVLLYFGFIKPYKGLDILLTCFEEWKENNLTLIIAGDVESNQLKDELLLRLKRVPKNLSILTDLNFIEPSKIPIYFNAADMVVLPYKKITHSGVLHLAYSFAKPVLATKVGDFEESIDNFKSGLLVNPDDISDLSKALKKITSGELDLKSMGEYAKKINDERYSWENSANGLIEIYKSLV